MRHGDVEMTLQQLLEKARNTTMSDADRETQRQSFVYGNCHFENETITRETVKRQSEKLHKADGDQSK